MKINEVIKNLNLQTVTEVYNPDRVISGAYSSDLLSDVIANSRKDNVWITLQTHLNITAVASLKELACIIIVMNKEIDKDTLEKAAVEKITILRTGMTSFQVSGKLYEYGIR